MYCRNMESFGLLRIPLARSLPAPLTSGSVCVIKFIQDGRHFAKFCYILSRYAVSTEANRMRQILTDREKFCPSVDISINAENRFAEKRHHFSRQKNEKNLHFRTSLALFKKYFSETTHSFRNNTTGL